MVLKRDSLPSFTAAVVLKIDIQWHRAAVETNIQEKGILTQQSRMSPAPWTHQCLLDSPHFALSCAFEKNPHRVRSLRSSPFAQSRSSRPTSQCTHFSRRSSPPPSSCNLPPHLAPTSARARGVHDLERMLLRESGDSASYVGARRALRADAE